MIGIPIVLLLGLVAFAAGVAFGVAARMTVERREEERALEELRYILKR